MLPKKHLSKLLRAISCNDFTPANLSGNLNRNYCAPRLIQAQIKSICPVTMLMSTTFNANILKNLASDVRGLKHRYRHWGIKVGFINLWPFYAT
jgi:hypothetical protein